MTVQDAQTLPVDPASQHIHIRHMLVFGALVAGSAFTIAGALKLDPDALGEFGIIDIMSWQAWIGLGILLVGFSTSLTTTASRTMLPWLFLLAFIAALHLVPAYTYGTLRYSWAWKHVGVVDYIMRNGSLDRDALYLAAYHNWPGFFVVWAWIAQRLALQPLDIAAVAAYAPPAFAAANLLVLHRLFSIITQDRPLIFLAQFVFLTGNWIGQDYFSPQAATFLLYLMAMLLCFGLLARHQPPSDLLRRSVGGRLSAVLALENEGAVASKTQGHALAASLLLMIIMAIIIGSHQLTPLVLAFALTGMALLGRLDLGFAVLCGVLIALWNLYFAAPFVERSIASELAGFGAALVNATDNVSDLRQLNASQATVSVISRTLTVGVGMLAMVGFIRRARAGHIDINPLILLAAPLPVLVMTSYGGEAIFRVYLFMLPGLAYLAAAAVFPSASAHHSRWLPLLVCCVGGLLIMGFLISNNGKDMQYRFRPSEVAAAAWLYEQAPKGSLLVEGARNYPSQFANYENFFYVPLASESPQARQDIIQDPVETFDRWLSDPKWTAGFIIFTRSQKAYAESQGVVPKGTFDHIIGVLSSSPRFQIAYRNTDAIIFTLNHQAPPGAPF